VTTLSHFYVDVCQSAAYNKITEANHASHIKII
jgi:hypothetical protein